MPLQKPDFAVPVNVLRDAARVGEAIVANNGGEPIDRLSLAEALAASPKSSGFQSLIASSNLYGLTKIDDESKVALTDVGRRYFEPESEEDQRIAILEAARTPPLLSRLFERFAGKQLPAADFAKGILKRQFGVPEAKTKRLWELFLDNAHFLGVSQEIRGNQFLNLARPSHPARTTDPVEGEIPDGEEEAGTDTNGDADEPIRSAENNLPPSQEALKQKLKVFITHGKNKRILEQIETIVRYGDMEPVVAIRQESTAIPVPDKIFNAMRSCQAGIINVSADQVTEGENGETEVKINQNVLIEIGAAFVLYNKKVVLVVDRRIILPSNLQGLYLCYYEGDSLDWDAGMKLQTTLLEFKR